VFGKIIGDSRIFKNVKPGAEVNISRHGEPESK
jgi:hypothetical protein